MKKLHIGGVSAAVQAAVLNKIHVLWLASATCQRACRVLGCFKLDNDPYIVMTLYSTSAAARLEQLQGDEWNVQPKFTGFCLQGYVVSYCCASKSTRTAGLMQIMQGQTCNGSAVALSQPQSTFICDIAIAFATILHCAFTLPAGPLPMAEVTSISLEILQGLAQLHAVNILLSISCIWI